MFSCLQSVGLGNLAQLVLRISLQLLLLARLLTAGAHLGVGYLHVFAYILWIEPSPGNIRLPWTYRAGRTAYQGDFSGDAGVADVEGGGRISIQTPMWYRYYSMKVMGATG